MPNSLQAQKGLVVVFQLQFLLNFFMNFLDQAPTSMCRFFNPSVHLSVVHHFLGTVHHLIIIFGTHV